MAHIEIVNDEIEIRTEWNERELIKQIAGARWSATDKVWRAPLAWSTCVMLRGVFGDKLIGGDKIATWSWEAKQRVDELLKLRVLISPLGGPDPDSKLYPFQQVGVEFLTLGIEDLLGDEMGTGKTIQVLSALDTIKKGNGQSSVFPAIVICPNAVKTNWAAEAAIWCPDATPYVVTGGAAGRKKILTEAAKDPSALVIVNFESARLLSRLAPYGSTRLRKCRVCDKKNGEEGIRITQCEVHPKELNRIAFKIVVVDEAHRIKSPSSKQTRAVWSIAHQSSVKYRWALTGTPIGNHLGDLWSLLHMIAPISFPTRTHFVDRFCLQSWNAFGGLNIVGINPANADEFYRIFDYHFRRMPKALVLTQLPEKIRSTRWVDLTPAQSKMYNQLKDGVAAQTTGGVLVAPDHLTLRTRLMQIASSTIRVETHGSDDPTMHEVEVIEPSPKLDELEFVLEELGERQAVICAQSRKLIELAAKRLDKSGISYGLITGKISEYERQHTLEQFQAGKLRLLLFTIQAGGTGLTMTAADTIIFLQRSDSMIDNKQAEDRVHRIGSEIHESIHVIDIIARNTVEEAQVANLTTKFLRLQEIARDVAAIKLAQAAGIVTANSDELEREEAMILNSSVAML